MHTLFTEGDGWEVEYLRDDADARQDKLNGVSHVKGMRRVNGYVAELRLEERVRDEEISVSALVYHAKSKADRDYTTPGNLYFHTKEFTGEKCKARAAEYASERKQEINERFFPSKPS